MSPAKLKGKTSKTKAKKKPSVFKSLKDKSVFKSLKDKEEDKLKVDQGESEMVVIGEMTEAPKKKVKAHIKKRGGNMDIWLGLEYLFAPVAGIIAYLMKMANMKIDKKYLEQANESIIFGIAAFIASVVISIFTLGIGSIFVLLGILYIAYMKAKNEKYEIPFVTKFTKENWPYKG